MNRQRKGQPPKQRPDCGQDLLDETDNIPSSVISMRMPVERYPKIDKNLPVLLFFSIIV